MEIHQAYIEAGAEIIETNTYGANRFKLGTYDLADKVRAINSVGAKLARNAREITGVPVFVAGAVGPLGRPVQPLGRIALAEARDIFREQIEGVALWRRGPDDAGNVQGPGEMLVALRAAREACDLPIVAQMSFEEDGRTLSGATPAEVVRALEDAGAAVIGANCSTGPMRMERVIGRDGGGGATSPLSAQPNAGWPEMVAGRIVYVSGPEYMAEFGHHMAASGRQASSAAAAAPPRSTSANWPPNCGGTPSETARPPARRCRADRRRATRGRGRAAARCRCGCTRSPSTVPTTGLEQPRSARAEAPRPAPSPGSWAASSWRRSN